MPICWGKYLSGRRFVPIDGDDKGATRRSRTWATRWGEHAVGSKRQVVGITCMGRRAFSEGSLHVRVLQVALVATFVTSLTLSLNSLGSGITGDGINNCGGLTGAAVHTA
jgi:hypothetical protein